LTTVKELKAYLETLPEDTEVNVACQYSGSYYYDGTEWRDMNLHPYEGNVEYIMGTEGVPGTLYLGDA
jgi:hypothetical protein